MNKVRTFLFMFIIFNFVLIMLVEITFYNWQNGNPLIYYQKHGEFWKFLGELFSFLNVLINYTVQPFAFNTIIYSRSKFVLNKRRFKEKDSWTFGSNSFKTIFFKENRILIEQLSSEILGRGTLWTKKLLYCKYQWPDGTLFGWL